MRKGFTGWKMICHPQGSGDSFGIHRDLVGRSYDIKAQDIFYFLGRSWEVVSQLKTVSVHD